MVLEVVAAVFCRDDRVLCLRRSASRSQAGLWEFPGGKVEVNESLAEALVREIKEELCVVIEVCLLYTSPSPRDRTRSRMPSSA